MHCYLHAGVLVHKVWNATGNKYKLVQTVKETAENDRCTVSKQISVYCS